MTTTVSFRTENELKEQATDLFNSLGMSLSTAINIFLRQAVLKRRYPCSLDLEITQLDAGATYPAGFFSFFGSGKELGLDDEPADLVLAPERIEL